MVNESKQSKIQLNGKASIHGAVVIRSIFLCVPARCSSVVRAFAHGAMGCLIDLSWWTH